MSRRVHPVEKLVRAVISDHYSPTGSQARSEKLVARHVKPLLDALEKYHWRQHLNSDVCAACNCQIQSLLAAWKEPL